MNKKTKIVCTLGPATSSQSVLESLLKAGMNVARLNFSHGDYSAQLKIIENLRKASRKTGISVAIMQDLQGPKIRIGLLPDPGISFKKAEQFILSTSADKYSDQKGLKTIPVQYKNLHKDVKKNDIILIEDGLISTKVINVTGQAIRVEATRDCTLKSHKGINVPTASISANPLTPKDQKDLVFGLKNQVDYVALSFVRQEKDIQTLRKIIEKHGSKAQIIAKIERHEAIKNIEKITASADAIMVARGDLGVETPATEVPLHQKLMVKTALQMGKPVIIATEMLQSMIEKPRATRAEVSDAANAVFDHADALMLSNETAVGKYPLEAVATLRQVAENVEKFQQEHHYFANHHFNPAYDNEASELCRAAIILAEDTGTEYIIALSKSGFTAKHLAKNRGNAKIICITPNDITARQLNLVWGVTKTIISKQQKLEQIKKLLLDNQILKKGQKFVLVKNGENQDRSISMQTA